MKKRWIPGVIFLLAVMLFGCMDEPAEALPTQTKKLTSTIVPAGIPSHIPTVTKTALPPSKTPTPFERTIDFDASICEASDDEKAEWVESIYVEDNDCEYPCMFNHAFVLGETKSAEALTNLRCVYEIVSRESVEIDGKTYKKYGFLLTGEYDAFPAGGMIVTVDDEILFISELLNSSLDDFLTDYGIPEETLGLGIGTELGDIGDYWLALFYRRMGMIVNYEGRTNSGVRLEVCESDFKDGPVNVTTFNPDFVKDNDTEEIFKLYNSFLLDWGSWYPFDDITDTDTGAFFDGYFGDNLDDCFCLYDWRHYFENPEKFAHSTPTPAE